MPGRLVTVFGGNGFVGRHIVQRLAQQGARVRVACRDPEAAIFLKPLGDPGQIVTVKANVAVIEEVERAVADADTVVNCVGLLAPFGRNTFQRAHVEGAGNIAKAAKAAGATAMVQVSALGADAQSDAVYAKTKAEGEQAVLSAFPEAVILRPSIIVGPDDNFFNMFAAMARLSPALPVIGCSLFPRVSMKSSEGSAYGNINYEFCDSGGPKFQPIFVGDVADAVLEGLGNPGARGKIYELCGPRIYSFRELMELMLKTIQRDRILMPIPFAMATIMAFFMELVPGKPLTRDQVKLLRTDNVLSGDNPVAQDLGITPRGIEAELSYLTAYRPPSGRRSRIREA